MTARDEVAPEGSWKFDGEVTEAFDNMLARSIPQIDVMRRAVTDIALRFAQPQTDVLDLGCSRGEAMAPLVDSLSGRCWFVGCDVSEPMLAAARERFAGEITNGIVRIARTDLREKFPTTRPTSVTLAVLTLQFVPIEYRQQIVRSVFDRTVAGGVFIVVEKVLGATGLLDEVMVDNYLRLKEEHGYSREDIDRKRLSLEGVLVPVTARWNEEILTTAGFGPVDCFWRWMNFAGWVAVKR